MIDDAIKDAMGLVDVLEDAIAKARWKTVFAGGDILMDFFEQRPGLVKARGTCHVSVDGRMVVNISAVVDRGILDFPQRLVDFCDGMLVFDLDSLLDVPCLSSTQTSTRVAEISKGMKINRGVSSFRSGNQNPTGGKQNCGGGARSEPGHIFLHQTWHEQHFVALESSMTRITGWDRVLL